MDERLKAYVAGLAAGREDPLLARLRAATAPLEMARMQISPEVGLLLALLARSVGARRTLEVGVFTGYSALCVARALPADGRLVACDVSAEWTAIGRPFWAEAGVADRIDLRLAPAAETLDALVADGEVERFDFAFVDADKTGYDGYYEQCLVLVRPGGLIVFDNAFQGGRVVDGEDESARALRALNAKVFADERVEPAIVPLRDGLLLAWKR